MLKYASPQNTVSSTTATTAPRAANAAGLASARSWSEITAGSAAFCAQAHIASRKPAAKTASIGYSGRK